MTSNTCDDSCANNRNEFDVEAIHGQARSGSARECYGRSLSVSQACCRRLESKIHQVSLISHNLLVESLINRHPACGQGILVIRPVTIRVVLTAPHFSKHVDNAF